LNHGGEPVFIQLRASRIANIECRHSTPQSSLEDGQLLGDVVGRCSRLAPNADPDLLKITLAAESADECFVGDVEADHRFRLPLSRGFYRGRVSPKGAIANLPENAIEVGS
jgi:hypothetical protein